MKRDEGKQMRRMRIHGARCALGPHTSERASIQLDGRRVTCIASGSGQLPANSDDAQIDLSGFLLLPGLINAHDHLEFALFPRLANPPYRNYIEWGEDIHARFPETIAKHHAVPKDVRLWWGGIRNLLSGVTTVSHHNPLWPELRREGFPVRVVQEYGWAHSAVLGGDLRAARAATPERYPFIMHACEGVDETARRELWELDRLGLLDSAAVLVHGLALDREGIELMRERDASLIVCPSSNQFLFGKLPDLSLLGAIEHVALGSDSPLTAVGDLLDEIRFAARFCRLAPRDAYRMVTNAPATIFRLQHGEGCLRESGTADMIAVSDTGAGAADRLIMLSARDVEFAMIGGRVQLASEAILERLPAIARHGLEPLLVDQSVRWLRAPIQELLRKAEDALGANQVRLGGRVVRNPSCVVAEHAC